VEPVDEYFASLEPPTRALFERIRGIAMELAPAAEQTTSYGMAALRYEGKPLVAFLAAKRHLSIFPCSSAVVDAVRGQLEGFDLSKGTIRFTVTTPLPDEVVRDVIRHRMNEIVGTPR
jgi:uncharacterized protein YdhG (YjbR/CyaY superfamily)